MTMESGWDAENARSSQGMHVLKEKMGYHFAGEFTNKTKSVEMEGSKWKKGRTVMMETFTMVMDATANARLRKAGTAS